MSIRPWPELIDIPVFQCFISDILKVKFKLFAVEDVEELIPFQVRLIGVFLTRKTEPDPVVNFLPIEVAHLDWPGFPGFCP